MDRVQGRRKRVLHKTSPSEKVTDTQLEASERVVRLLIMGAFLSVLAFEAWLLAQVWQLF